MSTKPNHVVELLEPDQWHRYRELRLIALRDSPDAFGSTLEQEQHQPESFWRARLARAQATLIASSYNRDVGIAVVAAINHEPHHAGLFSVWVDPQARGQGISDLLVAHAIICASSAGFYKLSLEVGDHNQHAINLYLRMGFKPTGRTSRFSPPREHITEHELSITL